MSTRIRQCASRIISQVKTVAKVAIEHEEGEHADQPREDHHRDGHDGDVAPTGEPEEGPRRMPLLRQPVEGA